MQWLDANRVVVRSKRLSFLMRAAALVLPRSFMSSFWTTVGRTIYVPEMATFATIGLGLLVHEAFHVNEHVRRGWASRVTRMILYVSPQCLSIPLALLFLSLGMGFWSVMAAILLLPWPSPARWREEADAVIASRVVIRRAGLEVHPTTTRLMLAYMAPIIAGPGYLWASWSVAAVERRMVDAVERERATGSTRIPRVDAFIRLLEVIR